jgi:hypothetical protein
MNLSSTNKKEIKRFGIVAFMVFGALCALGVWRQKTIPIYFFGILALMGLCFIMQPTKFKPLYDGWLKVARKIAFIVNLTILTLTYYLFMTPTALIKRIFGGRPLPVKPDKNLHSYWVMRAEPAQPKERFIKRF